MKKIILTLGIAACFALQSQAQLYSKNSSFVGIKVGGSAASFVGDDDKNMRFVYGFNAGLFANIALAKPFSIQPELLYSMKGAKASAALPDYIKDSYVRLNYIDLPIALRANFSDLFVEAGPQVGYLLSAKSYNLDADAIDVKDGFNKFDAGFLVGVGYQPQLGGLGIGFRYNASVLNAPKNLPDGTASAKLRNSAAQLYLTYSPKGHKYKNKRRH